jgi:putative ATP-dependent endonuclease of the OLD family
MKIAGLIIKNFKRIGDIECRIRIDEIVVLVGQNNSGKSTVLDAYEVFASTGKELDESHFHQSKTLKPIEITGVFTEISAADAETLGGQKWVHLDPEFGSCIKAKWVWPKPGAKGEKHGFNPETNNYELGGLGGWDTLLQSRIPQPVRIKPTDPPETTQTKIVAMLKEHVKTTLKTDSESTKAALEQIELLAKKIFDQSKTAFDEVASKISNSVSEVFPGTKIEIIPRSKDNLDEKVIGAESFIRVETSQGAQTPLLMQGTGIQRALLWSALSVMTDAGSSKKKTKANDEIGRILLIDEPEAFLHPPTIRSARDALYEFALNNPGWQVIATTHSPIFIDLSRDHTSIIRVDANSTEQRYVSTDKFSFDGNERDCLQMVRACNPVVNEFFFYDRIVLVEGPTEQIAMQHVAKEKNIPVHVINCLGKANIALFAKILNQFRVPYLVIHDSDVPKVVRKEKWISGGMWTVNKTIRDVVSESNSGQIFTQFPHFEGEFLDENLSAGKVDRVLELLRNQECNEYKKFVEVYTRVLNNDGELMTTTEKAFASKMAAYIAKLGTNAGEAWT